MKFKIGQKVKIIKNLSSISSANDEIGKIGTIERVIIGFNYPYCIKGIKNAWCDEELELVEKSWDTLEVGDEIKDDNGYSRWVLGLCGRVIFVSDLNNKDANAGSYTKEELIRYGYTIVQPKEEETPEIPEYTMEEAIKIVGHNFKIKK